MALAHPLYPMRAVIRCQAQQQLLLALSQAQDATAVDESLFHEIAATLFQSELAQAIYTAYPDRAAVQAAEAEVAAEIVIIYQQIMAQRQSPVVQTLNALLD